MCQVMSNSKFIEIVAVYGRSIALYVQWNSTRHDVSGRAIFALR